MRENGKNETAISTLVLKISRKLRDCYLPGLAVGKVTCFCLCMCMCVCVYVYELISWEIESVADLPGNSRDYTGGQNLRSDKQTVFFSAVGSFVNASLCGAPAWSVDLRSSPVKVI